MLPSWIRSRNCRPRLVYFFAIETTRRRLASTSSFFACSACASPRRMVSSVRRSCSGVSSSSSAWRLISAFSSFCFPRATLRSSSFSFALPRTFAVSCRSRPSHSRCSRCTRSTDSLMSSIRRRLTDSVNSIAPDQLRHAHARAHRLPARLAVLLLVLPRRVLELLQRLLVRLARLAHRVDLLENLARALLDALVGNLFVVEDHELADRALAGLQVVAHLDDLPGDSSASARST